MKKRATMIFAAVTGCMLSALFSCKPQEVDEVDVGKAVEDLMPLEVLVTDLAPLVGSEWKLMDFCGEAVSEDGSVTLQFLVDDRISGGASVNRYNGPFSLVDGGIEVGPFATTKMAGAPEDMERERGYLAALEAAKSVAMIGDDRLIIAVEGKDLPLRYEVIQKP